MHGLTGGGWKRGNLRHRASPLPSQNLPLTVTSDTPTWARSRYNERTK